MNLTLHLWPGGKARISSPCCFHHGERPSICLACVEVGCKDNYLSTWKRHWDIPDRILSCACVGCVCAHTRGGGHCLLFELAGKMPRLSTFKQHPGRLCIPKMARTTTQALHALLEYNTGRSLPFESGQVLWSKENDGSGPVPNTGIVLWTIWTFLLNPASYFLFTCVLLQSAIMMMTFSDDLSAERQLQQTPKWVTSYTPSLVQPSDGHSPNHFWV